MELMADYERSAPEVRGLLEVQAEAYADVSGVRVSRTVQTRRVFKISLPGDGCAKRTEEELMTLPADGFSSVIHVNPVSLGTHVEARRAVAPNPEEDP